MTEAFIADVSEWQPNIDADAYVAAGYRAIGCRVCYGTTADKRIGVRRDYLRARVPIIGWYLFLRSSESWQAQLATFYSLIPTLGRFEFVAVDWERDTDGSLPPVAVRDAVLADLAAHYHRKPWLYGPASLLAANPAPGGDPEWPAAYGQGDPNLAGEKLWQYTDGRYSSGGLHPINFPGIGLCDASRFPGGYDALEALLTGQSSLAPAASGPPAPGMLTGVVGFSPTADSKGYWLAQADGGVFCHGDATFHGSMGGHPLNQPCVGLAARPQGDGYWLAAEDGGIFAFGAAAFDGSMGGTKLNKPVVAIAATPSGNGYWLAASDGGIFSFGDAAFDGSTGAQHLNSPVVGIAATPSGKGYWLAAADGGIFSFGDAGFHGSMGGQHLNAPVVAIAARPQGDGYWLAGADGGIFAFGGAVEAGNLVGKTLARPPTVIRPTGSGNGYWIVAADGGVFPFGDAGFFGAGS